ncbi:sigma-54-dependent Fis family transcriptional regulator, partial [Pseudomonas aeruginosa]|uniref:sigma-54-dependent Fis family transcriptional regulator n=1 Tax=Pseudomonas aeruginosa TaxID=287 RepID=UPI003BF50255
MLSAHSKDHVDCVSRVLRNAARLPQAPVPTPILDSWRRSMERAREIENAFFMHSAQGHWVLRAHRAPGYVDSQPDYLFAWDADGRLLALNPAARHYLRQRLGQVPSHIGEVFDLDALHAAADQAPCLLRGQAGELHVRLSAPRAKARRLEREVPDDAALDPRIAESLRLAVRVKDRNLPVLIQGETGAGKEVFARQLHQASARRDKPFVALNCAAIPESLIESELFGYVGGAFTGAAAKGMRGLLQQADGGTLFLDEIGDMPLGLQTRLLTHRDLAALVAAGGFREDLYFRLGGARFELPPLRERSDRLALIRRILDEETAHCGVRIELGEAALECLLGYRWPGNVRQLRHVLRYACALCGGATLQLADLPAELRG